MVTHTMKVAAAVLMAALANASPAWAGQSEGSKPTAQVRYGDLDLTSSEGLNRLDQRIHKAAEMVCGIGTNNRAEWYDQLVCETSAIASATDSRSLAIASAVQNGPVQAKARTAVITLVAN